LATLTLALVSCHAPPPEPPPAPAGKSAAEEEPPGDEEEEVDDESDDEAETTSEALKAATPHERAAIDAIDRKLPWAEATFSGVIASPGNPDLDPLLTRCGPGDGALHDAAEALAELSLDQVEIEPEIINYFLRKRGAPYLTPEVWSVEFEGPLRAEVEEAARGFLEGNRSKNPIRCGIGLASSGRTQALVILRAQNPGQLLPIPMKVAPNTKQLIEVRLLDPPLGAELVALPPLGGARRSAMTVSGERAQAEVYLADPGEWLIQIMVDSSGGPKAVFLAAIEVGGETKLYSERKAVPGEKALKADDAPEVAILAMLNQARKTAHLPPLKRNGALDQIARRHSENMARLGLISHDTGDGIPARRLEAAGLTVAAAGENVAKAPTVLRLHRTLWASPSHRENMLLSRWEEVGIGVTKDDSGRLFLTQLFVDR